MGVSLFLLPPLAIPTSNRGSSSDPASSPATTFVVNGAALACSFGLARSTLTVIPLGITAGGLPVASITASAPMVNIASFGMCTIQANPAVAAATAAALGTPTPAPCVPMTAAPWSPGATEVTVMGQPALISTCTASCAWGGVITITSPGQASVQAT